MAGFEQHFKMEESDAIRYIKEKTKLFSGDAALWCKEIGDGNINYIFRIEDVDTGRSVILKQADTVTRSSHNPISTDRSRIEAEILKLEDGFAHGLVPVVYLYDPIMCCTVMEDLKDYGNMRYELAARHIFPSFAEDISTFMAETLIRTTDNILTPHEKKAQVQRFMNPDLCRITENLVYTDPYLNVQGENELNPDNEDFFVREIYGDRELQLEAAKLKEQFKSKAQALIHGDLHTGSIMVKAGSTKVLDPEFACYAPIGYDVGNIVANLLFAWVNAQVTMSGDGKKAEFQSWLAQMITDTVDLFKEKAVRILKEAGTEKMAAAAGFAEWYVDDILKDTAGVAGLEMIRRIVGTARVKDIDGIEDPRGKAAAERICVMAAKEMIKNRSENYFQGRCYLEAIKRSVDRFGQGSGTETDSGKIRACLIKEQLLQVTRRSYQEQLFAGTSGNLSIYNREEGIMAITPSSIPYETMEAGDMVLMRLDGEIVEGIHKPSSEWRMHAAVYLGRSDISALLHTHSPYATSFAVNQEAIPVILIEMVYFLGGDVPVARFALPGTEEVGKEALRVLSGRHACLMSNHGVLAVGGDLEQAHLRAVYAEDAAKIYSLAKSNGSVQIIPEEYVTAMRQGGDE